jgi:hypothetical protein
VVERIDRGATLRPRGGLQDFPVALLLIQTEGATLLPAQHLRDDAEAFPIEFPFEQAALLLLQGRCLCKRCGCLAK